jgi:SAM-dependent MidA family methyltransferase
MPPRPSLALDLPAPDPDDARDSAALTARIREACAAAGGAIAFDAYMELALYAPVLGYYAAPRSRFGERGDFVTAPELSPRFAACVGRQVAEVLGRIGGGVVLEVGAGDGTLAAGVLEALDALGHGDTRYLILERSAAARGFQGERLAAAGERVAWLDALPAAGFRGVILANELLDAIPARRFVVHGGTPLELGVAASAEGFRWQALGPAPDVAAALGALLDTLPGGYQGEFGPARGAWVRTAAAGLEAGALLLLDYGYPRRELYHPQRVEGTLACHYRHRVHADPFLRPGLQDISAHVDFTAVAESGVDAGLELAGYTTQAHFLLATGLLEGLGGAAGDSPGRIADTGAVQRLLMPGEMGEAVKVMALARGLDAPLAGFGGRDLRHRL